mmetsp:Transcript_15927/g.23430  ORF Transcript_15927/g.23430 Transcript_15927/m.23430 type:complete len:460 (-) Transcript_15927:829-2208(-)
MTSSKKRRLRNPSETEMLLDCTQDEGGQLHTSNLAQEKPIVGMKLEIRDSDYIWSSGTLREVKKKSKSGKIEVTVASDGWGREWDEVMEWPNDRLAKLYTYTREVKCFLDLLTKKRRKSSSKDSMSQYCTLWPIIVQFRMPHPGVELARDHLMLEDKLFIQPYGIDLLPSDVRERMVHDNGCWFHHTRLRLWRDNPHSCVSLHPSFMQAFKIGQEDSKGTLPPKTLQHNTLLKDIYLVHSNIGCNAFDGKLREEKPPLRREPYEIVGEAEETGSQSDNIEKPPSVVAIHNIVKYDSKFEEIEICKEPKLPPALSIQTQLYPRSGVKKCEITNKWVASVSMNGNQVFLGYFPTESQAWIATRKALGEEDLILPETEHDARYDDLQAVSLENIIDAYETHSDPEVQSFSLHDWTVEKVKHIGYLKTKCEYNQQQSKGIEPSTTKRKRKRKEFPTKVIRTAI